MNTVSYTINDAQSDVLHLKILIDTAIEYHLNAPSDGYTEHERVSALLWVARDLACTIDRSICEIDL